jgi:hypothetical protein
VEEITVAGTTEVATLEAATVVATLAEVAHAQLFGDNAAAVDGQVRHAARPGLARLRTSGTPSVLREMYPRNARCRRRLHRVK